MKTIPIAAHYAQPVTTLCTCLKLVSGEGSDALVLGITSLERTLEVDGILYRPGFEPTDMVSTSGLQVDNLELNILPDDDELLVADLLAGRWDNAEFTIFEVNFKNPAAGINVLKRGRTGQAKANRGQWTIEFRSLKQALQQTLGAVTSKTCRYRLGSTSMPDGLCRVDLAPFTFPVTVTSVGAPRFFTDSARAEADDYFAEGEILWGTGLNAGYRHKIRAFSGGEFELAAPVWFAIEVGDTATAIAGCQKRLEDCIDKFDNVLNFGGEPHLQGTDSLTADPEVEAP